MTSETTGSSTPFVNHGRLVAQRAELQGPRDPFIPSPRPAETSTDRLITASIYQDDFCPEAT